MNEKNHRTILAVLQFIFAFVQALALPVLIGWLFSVNKLGSDLPGGVPRSFVDQFNAVKGTMSLSGYMTLGLTILITIALILNGVLLLAGKGRLYSTIAFIIELAYFPVGTLVGLYGIYILHHRSIDNMLKISENRFVVADEPSNASTEKPVKSEPVAVPAPKAEKPIGMEPSAHPVSKGSTAAKPAKQGASLLVVLILLAVFAVLAAGIFGGFALSGMTSPSVCTVNDETIIFSGPISSSEKLGTVGKGACFHIDGRTSGGWVRITGITEFRGGWIYYTYLDLDLEELKQFEVVK